MRASVLLSAIGWALLAGTSAFAQQGGRGLEAEQRDIGRLETHIRNYGQALGVITQLTRPLGAETECEGVCYSANSSKPVSWSCAPTQRCDLHCLASPPVGGCD